MAGELFKYLAIDKWGEPRMYYLITHQDRDHLRKAESLPGQVTVILGKKRHERFGEERVDERNRVIRGVLCDYYEYLEKHGVRFHRILLKEGELFKPQSFSIRLLETETHSDIYLIYYRGRRAMVVGDLDPEETDTLMKIAAIREPDELYLPAYSYHADRRYSKYGRGVLKWAVDRLAQRIKNDRITFPKTPQLIALGHSKGVERPEWADEFIPKSAATMEQD
jgi:hypothetical protein